MRRIKKDCLMIAVLTLVLAVPGLAEDVDREPIAIDDVQAEVVQETREPLQGQQCRADAGSANGEVTVESLEALDDTLVSSPCLDVPEGSTVQTGGIPACNCEVGLSCIRLCASASQTPQCLDIDCILGGSANDNGVCTCVGG